MHFLKEESQELLRILLMTALVFCQPRKNGRKEKVFSYPHSSKSR